MLPATAPAASRISLRRSLSLCAATSKSSRVASGRSDTRAAKACSSRWVSGSEPDATGSSRAAVTGSSIRARRIAGCLLSSRSRITGSNRCARRVQQPDRRGRRQTAKVVLRQSGINQQRRITLAHGEQYGTRAEASRQHDVLLADTAEAVAATPTCTPHRAALYHAGAHVPALTGIEVSRTEDGVRLLIKASGPITGAASNLSTPNRILIRISGVGMASAKLPKVLPIHLGAVERVRYAVKNASQVWVVVDLGARLAFRTVQPGKDSFAVVLITDASASSPPAEQEPLAQSSAVSDGHGMAEVPRINLMLFDLNVIYQGKEYKRFPCANFIYNAGEHFPLKREFVSTLVFSHGYGAFVGNARILDPQGRMLAQTEQPFAFNLFNPLTEFMVELPWKVEFAEKGEYTLWVELSGSDVLKQSFYVGQTTDTPPAQ